MIFLACVLTVLIEGAFFTILGYRDRYALTVIVCANIVTNLLLNLTIYFAFSGQPGPWIYPMEAVVVAAEYVVYAIAFGRGWKLFFLTLAANCLSYGIGMALFR